MLPNEVSHSKLGPAFKRMEQLLLVGVWEEYQHTKVGKVLSFIIIIIIIIINK